MVKRGVFPVFLGVGSGFARRAHTDGRPASIYGRRASIYARLASINGCGASIYGRRAFIYARRAFIYGRCAFIYGRCAFICGRESSAAFCTALAGGWTVNGDEWAAHGRGDHGCMDASRKFASFGNERRRNFRVSSWQNPIPPT